MLDTLLNLIFRCPHRRLTRPVAAVRKRGVPQGPVYVACLDCGKRFAYDTDQWQVGKPLDGPSSSGNSSTVVPVRQS